MADDVSLDIPQLMARAERSLSAARLLIDNRLDSRLHRLLIDMFDERQLADYSGAGFTAERAKVAHQNAEAFVTAVRDFLNPKRRNLRE